MTETKKTVEYDIIIIGAGAAGFFAAISAAEVNPKILILEKSSKVLSKVKISSGGRCNVTHRCFENSKLVKFYPRGNKFLKGLFHKYNVKDTIDWFKEKAVELKTEEDGRMFPVTDNSQTIINCLLGEITRLKVNLHTSILSQEIKLNNENQF